MKDPIAVMCHNIAKYDREHPTPKIAPRLINANALIEILSDRYSQKIDTDRPIATGIDLAIGIINDSPTIDAVPVVRCKNCKHLETLYAGDTAIGHCDLGERETLGCKPDDFCSYGERKDRKK